jgi:sugar lactone lactonase YvrE
MRATPDIVTLIGDRLDHPECLCIGPDGTIYAGGEAGQIYRIDAKGQRQIASTDGFVLGIALDGHGRIHACDMIHRAIFVIDPDGGVHQRSTGTPEHPFMVPNYAVFDRAGRLFVSDSGDYWTKPGTGRIFVIEPDGRTRLFHRGPFDFANGLAIDPTGQWLYVVQSTTPNICRIPLACPDGPIEITHRLQVGVVPDGLAFSEDGLLLISCYKPDAVLLAGMDGKIEPYLEDPTGELLSRPTNVALFDGHLYIANLGGWQIARAATQLRPKPLYFPDNLTLQL